MKLYTPLIVGLFSFVLLAQNNNPAPAAISVTTEAEPVMVMLRIAVYDDTANNKISDLAEIWAGEHGWSVGKDVAFGGASKDLARFEAGKANRLIIYLDGRGGKEMIVPFLLTEDMCLDGCARNMVNLDISDKSVEVHGRPVENVTFAR